MPELNVPLWGQPSRNYCVPTCLKMIVEFLRLTYGDAIPKLSIRQIARIVRIEWDGTAPKDVERINEYFEAKLCIEFKALYMQRFPEIQKELSEDRPVITWINSQKPPDKIWHAVVVRGFEPNFVIFNDPWDCKRKTEEVGSFINKWGTEAKMVKLYISKDKQSYIYEYSREHQIEEESSHE